MSCLIFCVHLSICFLCFLRAKKQGIYIISPQIICHLVLCGPQIICAAGSSKTNWVHVSLGVFISTDGISLGCAHTRRWQEQPAGRSLAKVCVLLYRKLQPAAPAFFRPPHAECIKKETDPFVRAERHVSRLISRPVHAHKRSRPASFLFASLSSPTYCGPLVLINGKKMPRDY